jgi:hypothetical protein
MSVSGLPWRVASIALAVQAASSMPSSLPNTDLIPSGTSPNSASDRPTGPWRRLVADLISQSLKSLGTGQKDLKSLLGWRWELMWRTAG